MCSLTVTKDKITQDSDASFQELEMRKQRPNLTGKTQNLCLKNFRLKNKNNQAYV